MSYYWLIHVILPLHAPSGTLGVTVLVKFWQMILLSLQIGSHITASGVVCAGGVSATCIHPSSIQTTGYL